MSKKLMLMRYGEIGDGLLRDHLSEEGVQQAESVARQLVEVGEIPDLIVTSPILRAVETATALKDVFNRHGRDIPLIQRNCLMLDRGQGEQHSASHNFVRSQNDREQEKILFVTHGPNIHYLSYMCLKDCEREAGYAELDVIEADSWRNFNQGTCARTQQFKPA